MRTSHADILPSTAELKSIFLTYTEGAHRCAYQDAHAQVVQAQFCQNAFSSASHTQEYEHRHGKGKGHMADAVNHPSMIEKIYRKAFGS